MGILSEKGIMQHFITNVIPPIENKKQKIKKQLTALFIKHETVF